MKDESRTWIVQAQIALAYMYQYAGATDADVKVLDNLWALCMGDIPPHVWEYPAGVKKDLTLK